jgi:hypothetical protein
MSHGRPPLVYTRGYFGIERLTKEGIVALWRSALMNVYFD